MTEGRYTHGAHRGELDRVAFSLYARLNKGESSGKTAGRTHYFSFLKLACKRYYNLFLSSRRGVKWGVN